MMWGLPLYDFVIRGGSDRQSWNARGVIAVGAHASGVIAFGGATARGVIALAGGASAGVFAYAGGARVGLGACSGGASLGALALAGGVAIGAAVVTGGFPVGIMEFVPEIPEGGAYGYEWLITTMSHWWIAIAVLAPLAVALVARIHTRQIARRDNA